MSRTKRKKKKTTTNLNATFATRQAARLRSALDFLYQGKESPTVSQKSNMHICHRRIACQARYPVSSTYLLWASRTTHQPRIVTRRDRIPHGIQVLRQIWVLYSRSQVVWHGRVLRHRYLHRHLLVLVRVLMLMLVLVRELVLVLRRALGEVLVETLHTRQRRNWRPGARSVVVGRRLARLGMVGSVLAGRQGGR